MPYYRKPNLRTRAAIALKRVLPETWTAKAQGPKKVVKVWLLGSPPVVTQLFHYPGWLSISAWRSFLRHRNNRVPWRHAVALDALKRLDAFHRSIGAVTLLKDGALLGAVRQGAFAGRPSDLDVAVVSPEPVEQYLSLLRRNKSRYRLQELAHKHNELGPAKLKLRSKIGIDVRLCHHDPLAPGHLSEQHNHIEPSAWIYEWRGSSHALMAALHGEYFHIPENYVDILTTHYGTSWRVPTAPQSAMRTPNFTRLIEPSES